jgi:hypothetical protein
MTHQNQTPDTDWGTLDPLSLTPAQRVERDAYIWKLYLGRKSIRKIAEMVNLSKTRVGEIVSEVQLDISMPAKEALINREMELLEQMETVALQILEDSHVAHSNGRIVKDSNGNIVNDDSVKLAALDRLVKIQDRRSKYLGLDKPMETKHEVKVIDADTMALMQQLEGDSNGNSEEES